jgi:hypothetical protein
MFYPEDVAGIPSERAFRRKAEKIPQALILYMRHGEKAVMDKCMPFIERWYGDLEANDVWVADNHTLDFHSVDEDGKVHRLYLTAFTDAKSGVMAGWNLTPQLDSHSTFLAFRHGMLRMGAPRGIYVDNGSEFLTHDIGGRGHRTRKSWNKDDMPPTILEHMDIKMLNAQVGNAQAKPIERTFRKFKENFSRAIATFCGGNILERPDGWKILIKQGKIPTDEEISKWLELYIDGEYNVGEYGGSERKFKGMSRVEVWNESIKNTVFRKAAEGDLNLLLARTSRYQKIGRNGVKITVAGETLRYFSEKEGQETWRYIGREVFARYDPYNLNFARIYDKETKKYMFTWELQDMSLPFINANSEDVAEKIKVKNRAFKSLKEMSKGVAENVAPDKRVDMLFLKINNAEENGIKKFNIEQPSKFKPIVSEKTIYENPDLANIDSVEFLININNNAKNRLKKGKII